MIAVLGVWFVALAAILFAWAYGQYHRPSPPRWTRREAPSALVTLTTIALLAFGAGFLGRFVFDLAAQPFGLTDGLLAAIPVVLAVLLVPRLVRGTRTGRVPGAGSPAARIVAPLAEPANEPGPAPRPNPAGGPAKPRGPRRAA